MRYLIVLTLLGLAGWAIFQRLKHKLRVIRGQAEPDYKAPRSVKLLAAALIIIYALWIGLNFYRGT